MSNKIHKYEVSVTGAPIYMRKGAKVISVGAQDNDVVIWVTEDTRNVFENRVIFGKLTGEEVNPNCTYHGTAQLCNGVVVHVFEGESK